MKTKEKHDSLVFSLKCHLLGGRGGGNVKEAGGEREIKTSLLDTSGLRCWGDVQMIVSRRRGQVLFWTWWMSSETRGSCRNHATPPQKDSAVPGGGQAGMVKGSAAFAESVVHRHSAQLSVTWASQQPHPVGLILPSSQRRQQAPILKSLTTSAKIFSK